MGDLIVFVFPFIVTIILVIIWDVNKKQINSRMKDKGNETEAIDSNKKEYNLINEFELLKKDLEKERNKNEFYKARLFELEQENSNIKKQNELLCNKYKGQNSSLTFDNYLIPHNEIILYQGEYIVGLDIKPGRYSFKLLRGDDGQIETTGKNWIIQTLGSKWNGIYEYKNLTLKLNQKLKISGNVEVLFMEESPVNINEDITIIKQKNEEIEKLKNELCKIKKELLDYKNGINSQYQMDEFIMTTGVYVGGENVKIGYYDLKVISGSGYITSSNRNIYVKMGTQKDESLEYKGLRFSNKTRIEVTGNLVMKSIYKNIQF